MADTKVDTNKDVSAKDLKEKKQVEEAENGKDAPANGNAENEENGDPENEVDEEDDDVAEEDEEDDGEGDDDDEDEEAEGGTGKRAAEDDDDDEASLHFMLLKSSDKSKFLRLTKRLQCVTLTLFFQDDVDPKKQKTDV
ncbi:prothymosin alpha-A isoform X1 [Danio rerio]|uniref:Prothymosin alpha-A isoform X1 n=1 Tax=Danio rerio TaxID=7955 RepID=A0AC58JQG5_DANRE